MGGQGNIFKFQMNSDPTTAMSNNDQGLLKIHCCLSKSHNSSLFKKHLYKIQAQNKSGDFHVWFVSFHELNTLFFFTFIRIIGKVSIVQHVRTDGSFVSASFRFIQTDMSNRSSFGTEWMRLKVCRINPPDLFCTWILYNVF